MSDGFCFSTASAYCQELYQKYIKMSDINCFFFSSSSLKNSSITMAMKRFFASNKKKIFQFIYQSFGHVIGIICKMKFTNDVELTFCKPGL
jgi:hypothetical protein